MTIEEVECVLREKIQDARDRGLVLVHHRTRVFRTDEIIACCAVGSVVPNLGEHLSTIVPAVGKALHISQDAVCGIAAGWDGSHRYLGTDSWYDLGSKLRASFEPVYDARSRHIED